MKRDTPVPIALLALLAMLLLSACDVAFLFDGTQPTPAPTPGGGSTSALQAYFTKPVFPDAPSKHEPSLDARLADFIGSAQQRVDIAIYQLDLPNVTESLINAKKRGVNVRAVTDADTLKDPGERASLQELQKASIKVVGGNPNAIMHNKFVVVDGARVWTGSWNFTAHDTWRYNNHALLIESPALASNYTLVFERMWVNEQFGRQRKNTGVTTKLTIGGAPVENYFAPEDKVAEKIVARLKQATQSVDFMAFSFTDDTIGATIRERAKAGVKVRGVFENTGSETRFSEYGRMKSDGLDVWQDGNPYLMHHKVILIDGKVVILGSYNFTQNANEENDENVLIIEDARIAGEYAQEFARVLNTAKNPPKR